MPLYEFECGSCKKVWECHAPVGSTEKQECPDCLRDSGSRIVSKFAVGGQGDLRESTMHGCHDHSTGADHDH